jgi:hypothetical protein
LAASGAPPDRGTTAPRFFLRTLGALALGGLLRATIHRPEGEGPAVLGLLQTSLPGPEQRMLVGPPPERPLTYEHLPGVEHAAIRSDDLAACEARVDTRDSFHSELPLSSILELESDSLIVD